VLYLILSGPWLVPDSTVGMCGNHDGHWLSWNTRGMFEWGEFFDFSPFSPLVGTGSLFVRYCRPPGRQWSSSGSRAISLTSQRCSPLSGA